MTASLTLTRIKKHWHDTANWPDDDYVVLDTDRQCVGRIMRHPQTPEGREWFWSITKVGFPLSVHNRGYCTTREDAMRDFKSRWIEST